MQINFEKINSFNEVSNTNLKENFKICGQICLDNNQMYKVLCDGEEIGFFSFSEFISNTPGFEIFNNTFMIHTLYLIHNYRSRGIGRSILAKIEELAKEHKIERIYADICCSPYDLMKFPIGDKFNVVYENFIMKFFVQNGYKLAHKEVEDKVVKTL